MALAMPISSVPITKSLMDPTVSVEFTHAKRGFDVFLPAVSGKDRMCQLLYDTSCQLIVNLPNLHQVTLFCEKIVSKCTFGVSLKPIIVYIAF